jgi:polysaccharide export outer membrane protein
VSTNSRFRAIWLALAALVQLTCCSSPGSDLPSLPPKPDTSSYHLGPGDRIGIKALGADELAGDYLVQDDGSIRMLMIGQVPAAGLTPEQLERLIETKLKAGRYLTDPHASVALVTYRPFYILGEVVRPGGYPYASGMRVLSAIADAQGYTYRAHQDYVIITRNGEDKKADVLTSIQPDDIIRVPERYF